MPNIGLHWTSAEDARLAEQGGEGYKIEDWEELARGFRGRSGHALRQRYYEIKKGRVRVPESPYPKYDAPLVMEGDALILNDLEAPFHHAEFVNRVLDLADAWKIRNLVLGGDAVHFEALSTFDPAWMLDEPTVSPEIAAALMDIAVGLPKRQKQALEDVINEYAGEPAAPGFSQEVKEARKVMDVLAEQFDEVHLVLGNHEGRYLRMLASPLFADHILTELHRGNDPRWKAMPYYFSKVVSNGQTFRITHPRNSTKYSAAWKLAAKFQEHIVMGHNHHLVYTFDISGQFYALESGCAVDERRMPYASQRDNTSHQHVLGAVIIRGGIPWLLHERVDWDALKRA